MKDKAYWKALTERYFEAETTRKEEEALKAFAASTDHEDLVQAAKEVRKRENFFKHIEIPFSLWYNNSIE